MPMTGPAASLDSSVAVLLCRPGLTDAKSGCYRFRLTNKNGDDRTLKQLGSGDGISHQKLGGLNYCNEPYGWSGSQGT